MKFHSDTDAKMFLVEIDQIEKLNDVDKSLVPTDEMLGLLKKNRKSLRGLKNFRRSQSSKAVWRKYGTEIMKGIKSFHRSTEGKRFHKNLSRFLVRKDLTGFITGKPLGNRVTEDFWDKVEAIKAISSTRTHLFVEMEFYHEKYTQIGVDELVFEKIPDLTDIERKILHDVELTEENYSLLFLLAEENSLIKALAFKSGKEASEIESKWKEIKQQLIDQGKSEKDKNFFAILVATLKKALKIK